MHIPVLLHESITALNIQKGDIVVDGTFGGGGHTKAILAQFGEVLQKLICVDLDEAAQARFEELSLGKKAVFVNDNYKNASAILKEAKELCAHKVLLDLGTSSFQLDEDTRGFSFQSDTPLRMTLSQKGSHTGFSAYDIVNAWEESSIADIIFYYGGERSARKIAHALIQARKEKPITTSGELAALIERVCPRRGKIHPATKTFQAFRIAVNDELTVLKEALTAWWDILPQNGRIAVISFHSLEDRIVKQWMNAREDQKRVITKKPITPGKEELAQNPRARSAKLRIIEKL